MITNSFTLKKTTDDNVDSLVYAPPMSYTCEGYTIDSLSYSNIEF